MELYVHNWKERIGIIPNYQVLQWTRRAQDFGAFCLRVKVTDELAPLLREGHVIERSDCDEAMLIEDIRWVDAATQTCACSGRSVGAILNRRAVWVTTAQPPLLTGNVRTVMQTLLNRHAINPSDPARRLPIIFEPAAGLPTQSLQTSISWRPLGEAVAQLCRERGIGLRSIWRDGTVAIQPYPLTRNPVVFSKNWGTIAVQERFLSTRSNTTFALVAGEGEFPNRQVATVGGGAGLARFERYINASDLLQADFGTGYIAALRDRGQAALLQAQDEFCCEVARDSLAYRQDYDVGQIASITTAWGTQFDRLIAEATETFDQDGLAVDVTFTPTPLTTDY